jgi:type VII secretion-associated serine protease mycosin
MKSRAGIRRLGGILVLALTMSLSIPVSAARADQTRDGQWYLESLQVDEAQRISKGEGVTVAVIDSGVWAAHPDLRGAVLPGFNALGNGDGRKDTQGHGTQMAGIIAARGRAGGHGVLGIAPEAKIVPAAPALSALVVADEIDWAVEHGAKVINMSFLVLEDAVLAEAVQRAAAADVVLVAGSGNDGQGRRSGYEYPAAYPEVLAVGATNRAGKAAPFSHSGPQLDLVAPGADVTVANGDPDEEYQRVEGTSVSTAIVSGAAALIRSKFPKLSAADVVEVLESTATDKGPPGRDDTYGHGELNLVAALKAAASVEPSRTTVSARPAQPDVPDVIAGSGDRDEGLPRLAIVSFAALVLAGVLVALVVGLRRRR